MRRWRPGHGDDRRAVVATARVFADPGADLEQSLVDWRRFRKGKRVAAADVHWIDVLYRAYLTGIVCLVAVVAASGAVGDEPIVTRRGSTTCCATAPAGSVGSRRWPSRWACAPAAGAGRWPSSGRTCATCCSLPSTARARCAARPAPAPVPGLRRHVVGGVAGELASHRFAGETAGWVATGALGGLTAVGLVSGAALAGECAARAGWRRPWARPWSSLAVLDGAEVIGSAPPSRSGVSSCGRCEVDLLGLVPVAVAVVLVAAGSRSSGVCSLEDAERRSTLVGQLRFAATLQDLRTVVLLRRQLALELPRTALAPPARARHRPAAVRRARACGACCGGPRRASRAWPSWPWSPAVPSGACGRARRPSSCSLGSRCSWPGSTRSSRSPRRSTTRVAVTPRPRSR